MKPAATTSVITTATIALLLSKQRTTAIRQSIFSRQSSQGRGRLHPARHVHKENEQEELQPTFSCGSTWRTSSTCSILCPTGEDSVCPSGEYCYAGIPCSTNIKKRQDEMEEDLMQSAVKRRENYLYGNSKEDESGSYVCGHNYQDALDSIQQNSNYHSNRKSCQDGRSECPLGMECFASVFNPITQWQEVEVDEVGIEDDIQVSMEYNLSFFVSTKPVSFLNCTMDQDTASMSMDSFPDTFQQSNLHLPSFGSC